MCFLLYQISSSSAAGPSSRGRPLSRESTTSPNQRKSLLSTTSPSNRRKSRKQAKPLRARRRQHLALKEIKFYMRTTDLLLPRLPFSRCVRDTLLRVKGPVDATEYRWQKAALEALQEAAEAYLVTFFSDSSLLAYHAKRITVMPRDMRLISILRGHKWQA